MCLGAEECWGGGVGGGGGVCGGTVVDRESRPLGTADETAGGWRERRRYATPGQIATSPVPVPTAVSTALSERGRAI